MASEWIRSTPAGVELDVWVQPRASKDELVGLQGDALKVRLAAPPVDGEANDALVRYFAKLAGLPRSSVEIVRGHTGRRKTLRLKGIVAEEVRSLVPGP